MILQIRPDWGCHVVTDKAGKINLRFATKAEAREYCESHFGRRFGVTGVLDLDPTGEQAWQMGAVN